MDTQRQAKAEALLVYQELRQQRALLDAQAVDLAKKYEVIAKQLREDPTVMTSDYAELHDFTGGLEGLTLLIHDVKTNREQLQAQHGLLVKIGFRVEAEGFTHVTRQ
jgi:hypothetical protein